ncbi:Ubiquitin-like protein 3 [Allomyces javanicus]|nr:Ubiquitin-like protein 3 [Allomyces javanicus]
MSSPKDGAAPAATTGDAPVPADKVALTFLLVSGARSDKWVFDPTTRLDQVRARLLAEWPAAWSQDAPAPASPTQLRLLHRGRFLEPGSATLNDAHLPAGDTTVVHLIIKAVDAGETANASEPAKSSSPTGAHADSRGPGCRCVIL